VHAEWIDLGSGAFKSLDELVDQQVLAGRGKWLHDPSLVAGGDYQSVFFFDDEVAAGFAVAVVGDFVEEARFVEIDQSAQCADDRALRVADRDGHADDRGSDGPAKHRMPNGGAAFLQRTGNVVAIHVVEADPFRQHR